MDNDTILKNRAERFLRKQKKDERYKLNERFIDVVDNDNGVNSKRFIEKVWGMILENLTSETAKFNFYTLSLKYTLESWLQKFEIELIEHDSPKKAIEKELQRIEKQFYGEYYYPSQRDYYKDATIQGSNHNVKKEHLLTLLESIFIDKPFATKFVKWSMSPNTAYAMTLDIVYYMELKERLIKTPPSVSKEHKPKVIDEYKRIFDRYNWHIKQDKMNDTTAKLKVMADLKISKSKFYNAINYCKSLQINYIFSIFP